MNKQNTKVVDYDLYGIVSIRLINPSPADAKYFTDFLGDYKNSFDVKPDIIITYSENIDLKELTFIGLNHAAYNEDGFYILSGGRHPVKVKIRFEKIGNGCEIFCESGTKGIPLLNYIINLTFLHKGYIPLHASAFYYTGMGTLVMGWSKGGKTESLLSFALKGAKYIGDETVFISPDGKKMFGIPLPVCLWEWQLKQISELKPPVNGQKKLLFGNIHFLESIFKLFGYGILKNTYPVKMLGEVLPAFQRQLNIRVNPSKVFKNRVQNGMISVDKIILIMSHTSDEITIEKSDSSELVERMINSNEFELENFIQFYRTFKFAFPEMKNDFLENAFIIQKELLRKAFEGREIYKVTHPYPVSFEKLFDHMKQIFEKTKQAEIATNQALP